MFRRKNKNGEPRAKRFKTIRDAYALAKGQYSFVLLRCLLVFAPLWAVGIALGAIWNRPGYAAFVTFPIAALGGFFYFTRLASNAAYASIEGQAGAGASVLMSIRRGWTVSPAVNVNKNQDMVHRAVGRAGIILVGEGSNGVRIMLTEETKKVERFVPGVPVTTLIVGDGEGRVAINKLQRTMKKLPKQLSNNQVREVRNRLKAVGGFNMPIPKGPMPKNLRVPKI